MANAIIEINVGGRIYCTTVETLCRRGGILQELFQADSGWQGPRTLTDAHGRPFLDRDPDAFAGVLSYLRTGIAFVPNGISTEQLNHELESLFPGTKQCRAMSPMYSAIQRQPWFPTLQKWSETVRAFLQDSEHQDWPIRDFCYMLDATRQITLGCRRCICTIHDTILWIIEPYSVCTATEQMDMCSAIADVFQADSARIPKDDVCIILTFPSKEEI